MSVRVRPSDKPSGASLSSISYNEKVGAFQVGLRFPNAGLWTSAIARERPCFDSVSLMASSISGWFTAKEGQVVFDLAKDVSGDLAIVEIGSFLGRSTVYLGWGARLGHGAPVISIDPHQGSPEIRKVLSYKNTPGTGPVLEANLKRAGLSRLVFPLIETSRAAANAWTSLFEMGTVGLVLIDGDHDRAVNDFWLWTSAVVPGGHIAFHDSTEDWIDVNKAVKKAKENGYRVVSVVDSLTTLKKEGT